MTVRELKEELNKFQDNLIVVYPGAGVGYSPSNFVEFCGISHIYRGINEYDGLVFLGDCVEDVE